MNGGMERVPSRGRRLGKDVAVLSLGKFKGDPKAVLTFFPAFWCPYAPNETFTCKLDSSANFCFTTTMSGCSFGARKDGDQGQWTVAHANTQRDGGNTEQMATAQAAKLTEKLGDAATIIGPGHYRNDHNNAPVMNANTFGLRKDGEWAFYTQTYRVFNKTYILDKVIKRI